MAKLTQHVTRWMDTALARDPALHARVAQRMNELKLEEDLVALREARGRTTRAVAGCSQGQDAGCGAGVWNLTRLPSRRIDDLGRGVGSRWRPRHPLR